VIEAIRLINSSGFLAIIITNQSGIAKGLYSAADVNQIHQQINNTLASSQAQIDAFYFCPHHPEGINEYGIKCTCRKPLNGMILQAAKDFNIDLSASYFVGDSERDILAGKNSGCTTFRVQSGHPIDFENNSSDFVVEDIYEAIQKILLLS